VVARRKKKVNRRSSPQRPGLNVGLNRVIDEKIEMHAWNKITPKVGVAIIFASEAGDEGEGEIGQTAIVTRSALLMR